MKRVWIVPITVVLVVIVDAASKLWALSNLQLGDSKPLIPGILQLTLTTNTGGAFGIGREFGPLMTILPIAICGGIICWIHKREKSGAHLALLECIAFGLVVGGALGNIADRLFRGKVTDFLEFAFVSFPIFNVADALIDVGIALLIISTLSAPKELPGDVHG